jgi:surface protein
VNNGLFDISCIQTTPTSIINNGILSNIIPVPYGLSQNRGVGINYDNLVFVIDTRLESDNIFSFALGSTVDVFVDWGDGTREVFKTTGTKTHTYPSKGRYTVQVGGTLNTITFASMTGRGKLVSCLSFGNLSGLTACTFSGCTNLINVPNQIPRTFNSLASMFTSCSSFNDSSVCSWDTSNITNMSLTFSLATSFNKPVNSWNTKKVTAMNSMFGQSAFNQPLGSWDVSKVTNFSNMFNQAYTNGFNQDIGQWDVSSATNMSQMFYISTKFNQNLNSWNVSKVTTMQNMFYQASTFNGNISNWNVTSVTNMSAMFFQSPFNQNIGSWSVSGVQNMSSMFNGATAFNQDISSWNIRGFNAITSFDNFLASNSTFGTANLNAFYIALNTNKANYRTDLRPSFGSNTYYGSSSAAATARAALITYGWTITDGGATSAAPDAPTSVTGTAGNAQVALTWTAPVYNNGAAISDYTIQYSSNSGSSWTTFSHSASATASITVTGLTNSTAYIFRVAAVNSAGTGSYSSNSSSITPVAASFTPVAYILSSGTSYTIPSGATTMKAWAVGPGGNDTTYLGGYGSLAGAGGVAYKTWTGVTGGSTITYSIGTGLTGTTSSTSSTNTTSVTFSGTSISGYSGWCGATPGFGGGSFAGGDGGAAGGYAQDGNWTGEAYGALGGANGAITTFQRTPMNDISGLKAAVALAGGKTTEDQGTTAAFGSGGAIKKGTSKKITSGYGAGWGGNGVSSGDRGLGVVVLYFT